jgi:hypothetical protein
MESRLAGGNEQCRSDRLKSKSKAKSACVGRAYLAVATSFDQLVAEFGVARQDAPVDRTDGSCDLAIPAQYRVAQFENQQIGPSVWPDCGNRFERRAS